MNEENIHTPRDLVNLSPRQLTKNLKKQNYYEQEIYLENGHSDLDQHSDGYWYDAGSNQLYDVKKHPLPSAWRLGGRVNAPSALRPQHTHASQLPSYHIFLPQITDEQVVIVHPPFQFFTFQMPENRLVACPIHDNKPALNRIHTLTHQPLFLSPPRLPRYSITDYS